MKMSGERYAWIVCIMVCLMVGGCAAKPARNAGFVDETRMEKLEDLPFHKAWKKKGVDFSEFTEIYIPAVNTTYLLESDWWKDLNRYGEIKEDIEKFAEFTQEAFKTAFRDDPDHRFSVVERAGFTTLVVEIAIVELVPNKPALKAAGFIPGIGLAFSAVNQFTPSTVALEARIRDGATGEIVATFADREKEKMAPISGRNFTWYSHAEMIIEEWAGQLVVIANRQPEEIVKDSAKYSLKVW